MIVMYFAWALTKRAFTVKQRTVASGDNPAENADELTPLIPTDSRGRTTERKSIFDIVDIHSVDLHKDEHADSADDELEEEEMKRYLEGPFGWFWKLYYLIA